MNLLVILSIKSASTLKDYYIDAFSTIKEKTNIHLLFFSENQKTDLSIMAQKKYKTLGRNTTVITNLNDAIMYCKKESITEKNTFVTTYTEQYIYLSNMLKKSLGQKITLQPEMYNNKDLQRELLKKSDGGIKFQVHDINFKLNIEKITQTFEFPFIIKPSRGAASNGVKKITNLSDLKTYKRSLEGIKKKLHEKEYAAANILVEEFIEGQMCTIDYYVNQEGAYSLLPPLLSHTNQDQFGWEDLGVPNQYITGDFTRNSEMGKQTEKFIKDTIKYCGIKNTFIHHEFFITPKKKLKTIEINGRIGGYRLVTYKANLGINMLDLIYLPPKKYETTQVTLLRTFFPPHSSCIYTGNTYLLDEILKNGIVKHRKEMKKRIGKEIGRAQNGHRSFTNLVINYESLEELHKNNELFDKYILEEQYYQKIKESII